MHQELIKTTVTKNCLEFSQSSQDEQPRSHLRQKLLGWWHLKPEMQPPTDNQNLPPYRPDITLDEVYNWTENINDTDLRVHWAGVLAGVWPRCCWSCIEKLQHRDQSVHAVCSAVSDWGEECQSGEWILYLKQTNRFHLKCPAFINWQQT